MIQFDPVMCEFLPAVGQQQAVSELFFLHDPLLGDQIEHLGMATPCGKPGLLNCLTPKRSHNYLWAAHFVPAQHRAADGVQ